MEKLTEALYLLLHDSQFRARFRENPASLGPDLCSDFSTIDFEQLEKTAAQIAGKVFDAPTVLQSSLEKSFSSTIALLKKAEPDYRSLFLRSPRYLEYSDLACFEQSVSLEEAFYRFARELYPSTEPVARHECLSAHFQNLAAHDDRSFRTFSDFVQPMRNGFYSLQKYGQEHESSEAYLYACIRKNVISGPLDGNAVRVLKAVISASPLEREEDQPIAKELLAIGF